MNGFVAAALVMIAAALAWLLAPLLRREPRVTEVERPQVNLAVLREELADLDADLARGAISREQYEAGRADLERRVLEEAEGPAGNMADGMRDGERWPVAVIGAAVPLIAILLYLQVGNPEAISFRREHGGEAAITPEAIGQMVDRLAARLKENPGDAEGWALLARTQYVLGRYAESAAAYERAASVGQQSASLHADHADALAMSQDRRIDGKVLALVERALAIDPDEPKALIMASTAALERRDFRAAADYLGRLERVAPPGSELARLVGERLAAARAELGEKSAAPPAAGGLVASAAAISGRVAISPGLAQKAAPEDTVFVLARPLAGSHMPLAVVKRRVSDLPFEFTLSDEQAMSPQMKLSQFPEVEIVARVSKSGGATPQSGDLQGTRRAVRIGSRGIEVVIDSALP